eukprot:tig00020927_g15938.t1
MLTFAMPLAVTAPSALSAGSDGLVSTLSVPSVLAARGFPARLLSRRRPALVRAPSDSRSLAHFGAQRQFYFEMRSAGKSSPEPGPEPGRARRPASSSAGPEARMADREGDRRDWISPALRNALQALGALTRAIVAPAAGLPLCIFVSVSLECAAAVLSSTPAHAAAAAGRRAAGASSRGAQRTLMERVARFAADVGRAQARSSQTLQEGFLALLRRRPALALLVPLLCYALVGAVLAVLSASWGGCGGRRGARGTSAPSASSPSRRPTRRSSPAATRPHLPSLPGPSGERRRPLVLSVAGRFHRGCLEERGLSEESNPEECPVCEGTGRATGEYARLARRFLAERYTAMAAAAAIAAEREARRLEAAAAAPAAPPPRRRRRRPARGRRRPGSSRRGAPSSERFCSVHV